MNRRYLMTSLKIFLLLLAIFVLRFALDSKRVSNQRRALVLIEEAGIRPIWDYDLRRRVVDGRIVTVGPCGPSWFHSLIGLDYFRTVVGLGFNGSEIDDVKFLQITSLLHGLQFINLRGTKITEKGIAKLWQLPNLEDLSLDHTSISDRGMPSIGRCTNLRTLGLVGTLVTDSGLSHLNELNKLQTIHLSFTSVTTEGIGYVLRGSRETLQWLNVSHTLVDNNVTQILQGMDTLEIVSIKGTKINAEGRQVLQELLPACQVYY